MSSSTSGSAITQPGFWEELQRIIPDCKARRRRLNQIGKEMP